MTRMHFGSIGLIATVFQVFEIISPLKVQLWKVTNHFSVCLRFSESVPEAEEDPCAFIYPPLVDIFCLYWTGIVRFITETTAVMCVQWWVWDLLKENTLQSLTSQLVMISLFMKGGTVRMLRVKGTCVCVITPPTILLWQYNHIISCDAVTALALDFILIFL